jgi:hypothetical protein
LRQRTEPPALALWFVIAVALYAIILAAAGTAGSNGRLAPAVVLPTAQLVLIFNQVGAIRAARSRTGGNTADRQDPAVAPRSGGDRPAVWPDRKLVVAAGTTPVRVVARAPGSRLVAGLESGQARTGPLPAEPLQRAHGRACDTTRSRHGLVPALPPRSLLSSLATAFLTGLELLPRPPAAR